MFLFVLHCAVSMVTICVTCVRKRERLCGCVYICIVYVCVCVFSPGAGGVCRYTSSLYSPYPALLQPLTLSTYTLSISSLSITALLPLTSSNRCQPQRAAANPPRMPPLTPPPGTTPRRRYSTEKCQAGQESCGNRQHRKS